MKQKIQAFLGKVCDQVQCREVHEEIRLELGGHIEDVVDRYLSEGLSETEAMQRALADMGDPVLIGRQLNQTHRPHTDWGLATATVLLLLVGVWAMYAVDASGSLRYETNLLGAKLLWSGVGLGLGAALFFLDYRRLLRYSYLLYFATLAGTVLLSISLPRVNGQPPGVGDTPIFFAVALAGIFSTWDWDRRWALAQAAGLLAAPVLVYLMIGGLLIEGLQLIVAAGILLLRSRPHGWQTASLAGLGLLSIVPLALYVWDTHYLRMRLHAYLSPFSDPQGAGYVIIQSLQAIRRAGLWGQGATVNLDVLPDVHSDFVFPYLVYSLGWVAGAAICLAVLFFLGRMLLASLRVKDRYGSNLIIAAAALFAFRFGWNVLMTLGILPPAPVDLPFISHGMQAALQLGLVGLVLGIFRRKDLIRTSLVSE